MIRKLVLFSLLTALAIHAHGQTPAPAPPFSVTLNVSINGQPATLTLEGQIANIFGALAKSNVPNCGKAGAVPSPASLGCIVSTGTPGPAGPAGKQGLQGPAGPAGSGTNNLQSLSETATQVVSTKPIVAPAVIAGTPSAAAQAALPVGAGGFSFDETALCDQNKPAPGVDFICGSLAQHCILYSHNGSMPACITAAPVSGPQFTVQGHLFNGACITCATDGPFLVPIDSNITIGSIQ